MTQAEVTELVAILMAFYPEARFPPGTVVAYESMLIGLERPRAMQAVKHLVGTSKFMPKVSEIMDAYRGQKPPPGEPYHQSFRGLPQGPSSGIPGPAEVRTYLAKVMSALDRKE